LRRGGVGGKAPTLQEKVEMEVERWEKRRVTRLVESEFYVGVGVTLEVRLHLFKGKLK